MTIMMTLFDSSCPFELSWVSGSTADHFLGGRSVESSSLFEDADEFGDFARHTEDIDIIVIVDDFGDRPLE
ncbi:hypothetical protein EYZ11_001391 [Aspergillus tanneri]|uniref:Uncharacterized protein n=1 Tax=Aspergillus tanneri TaxID=1220188 RepID=A0A4V6RQY6_9EURO|nr:hypothetical protein EYZ11_001391 [Aspergillus tanneri]